jgi:hypothetical protein
MTLDEIQKMWEEDANIDPDNLHLESLKIPQLHSKYYKIYNNTMLLSKKCIQDINALKRDRYEFYNGKASPEIYAEEPFPFKVRDKESMSRYLEADEKLCHLKLKNEYYETTLKYLEEIIKTISNRTFQIKNAIDWNKFQAGFS